MNTDGSRFLDAFDQRWDAYRKQFEAAQQQISEDVVHDLRVAARRLLSMLALLRTVDANAPTDKLRRFVKTQLDDLDELRDSQVMLEEISHIFENLPRLAPIEIYEFQVYLEDREKKLLRLAQKDLNAASPSDIEHLVQELRLVAESHVRDELLFDKLLQAVDEANARVLERLQMVDAARPATIHRVRVAFKSFRYMIESVRPLVDGYPEDLVKCMHDYQDLMGSAHDVTVLLDTVHDFEAGLSRHSKDGSPEFAARKIDSYYSRRLDRLVRLYLKRKDEFFNFWRTAPDQPFPWERSHDTLRRTSRHRRATQPH